MKKRKDKRVLILPTTQQLEKELQKENYKYQYKKLLKSTIQTLIIVVAISILISNLLFPVLRIYGSSMNPTLTSNDIVVCIKKSKFKPGDIVAFYHNNHILVKRVIATSSNWVTLDYEGNIFVNDKLLNESYLERKSYGKTNIEFPYQVPEESYFLLGDEREISIDSRNLEVGSIKEENIIGKVIVRVWPIKQVKTF